MALGIEYSGRIREFNLLPHLIEEIKDIAEANGWKYKIYNEEFSGEFSDSDDYADYLYGISITPEQCETIPVCFLSNGKMSGPVQLRLFGKHHGEENAEFLYQLAVKTQFAGVPLHCRIVDIFRYLAPKYFSEFAFRDSGEYWESRDRTRVEINLENYNRMLARYKETLASIPEKGDESLEEYLNKVAEHMKRRNA